MEDRRQGVERQRVAGRGAADVVGSRQQLMVDGQLTEELSQ